ncbi:hypothetical protein GA707_05725 [Nostocoides sp. F2B08]|uniref:hypothetical protein n=1 Tax=Nostocoides sp. F2B08 TaxID=2653936 RepID=UPI001263D1B2|nr:hypothetical protein [Tetrasphaera sp. F2B08]KAB7745428.1 hypothetical protein GA707_05725 [Tetrasphaera sp. F2B08]
MSTHTTTPATDLRASPTAQATRPGTAGYWLGALVAILATVAALMWGTTTFLDWRSHLQDFSRLTADGTISVSVTDPGRFFVYLEHDRSTAVPTTPAVTVTGPSGEEAALRAYGAQLRYDVPGEPGQVGDAVLSFAADRTGTYAVVVADLEPGTAVAVGDHLARGWISPVVGSVALLLGGLLLGTVIVIVTAARRASAT